MYVESFAQVPPNATQRTMLTADDILPMAAGLYQPSYRSFIAWGQSNLVKPYTNNRGGVPLREKGKYLRYVNGNLIRAAYISPIAYNSVLEDFNPDVWGQLAVALQNDRTLLFADGQSRNKGLMDLYWAGGVELGHLDKRFSLLVVNAEDHLKTNDIYKILKRKSRDA